VLALGLAGMLLKWVYRIRHNQTPDRPILSE
jgi:hypothetical protein